MSSEKTTQPSKVKVQLIKNGKMDRVIRDSAFAKRFEQACDKFAQVPPKHAGRLTWIRDTLTSRFDENVSIESVRKWFAGEAKPRPDKLAKLASILEVDVVWLSLGIDQALEPRELKARRAMADGAVNLVAGLIQMDGGHPAFPSEDDGSEAAGVDLHAIIRGAKYDFHISLGTKDDSGLRFAIPANYHNLVVLGVVRTGFLFEIYEIPSEQIASGDHHGGSIDLLLPATALHQIKDFKNRI